MSSSPKPHTHKKLPHGSNGQPTSTGIFSLALNLLAAPLHPLRPFLPHVFPLIVCLLCIPLLMFLSGAAGWIVWRNVPVGWRTDVFLQYGDATNPFANEQLPPVMADQPYDISLHLVLPATESNFALGNFMATLRFTTAYNESITTIRRSATLIPLHNSLLKKSFMGSPSTTKVVIPLLSQFIFGTTSVNARLELGRSDGWKGIGNGQGRELSVLEATLKGTVRPRGIRAILARYPRLTTFISTFVFFFISLMIVSGILLTSLQPDSSSAQPPSSDGSGGSDSEDGHDFVGASPIVKRFSRSRSRKGDSESGSSTSDYERKHTHGLGSDVQTSGLRKRRSSVASENIHTNRPPILAKDEEFTSGPSTIPSLYPKSSFRRSSSTGSDTTLRRQNVAPNPVLVSETDPESQ